MNTHRRLTRPLFAFGFVFLISRARLGRRRRTAPEDGKLSPSVGGRWFVVNDVHHENVLAER
jgi:hypothetical protein